MTMAPVLLHLLMYADAAGIVEMVVDGLDKDSWRTTRTMSSPLWRSWTLSWWPAP